jgi:hypothetical protein
VSTPRKHGVRRRLAALTLLATLCALLALLGAPGSAFAAGCRHWQNPSGGAWNEAANWQGDQVPAAGEEACILLEGNYTVTLTQGATVGSLTLGSASGATTQTLEVQGSLGAATLSVTATSTVEKTGRLVLDSQVGFAMLEGPTFVNDGALQTQSEGSEPDYLRAALENAAGGRVEVKSGELRQDGGTTTTNAAGATFTVDSPATFTLTSGSGKLTNEGAITDEGSISLSAGTWTQSGNETGKPVVLHDVTLIDSAGSGQFTLEGTCDLSGTIPATQTITVTGTATNGAAVADLTSPVTNKGKLVLDSQSAGDYGMLEGEPLTNNGTLRTQSEGGENYLRVNLDNTTTAKTEITSGELRQDGATTTTNEGTFAVDAGADLQVTSGSSVFASKGKLAFGIASPASFGSIGVASGPALHLGGVAEPLLASGYDPAAGTEYDVIEVASGAYEGKFTSVLNDFSADYAKAGSIGLVSERDSTITTLSSSENPSSFGHAVLYTATVTPEAIGPSSPTGTVTFFEGGSEIGTYEVSTSAGMTTAPFTTLISYPVGSHTITASYGGNANYQPSPPSAPLTQVVEGPPSTKPSATATTATTGEAGVGILGFIATAAPAPHLAVSGDVALVSGSVLVRLPGTSVFVSLSSLRSIPFGTVIDATHGRVVVTTAGPHGGTQTGEFFEGEFVLTQGRNGLVVAALAGGDFAACPTARERGHIAGARGVVGHAAASGKHVVRKLWADAHGSFSTKGNYAAGAVAGTEWLTEDLCDGTMIRVTRDKVLVTNLVNQHRSIVKVGHSYLAKAP